jgi:PhzF family phenazine biosynthesis protein
VEFFLVDAFTDVPFRGNPAGVCLLDDPRDAAWMQAVARELRAGATAFVDRERGLRWFTPAAELELCGHATLATAHVLWERGEAADLEFQTLAGPVSAHREGALVELDLPSRPVAESAAPAGLAAALGAQPLWVGRGATDYLVELAAADIVIDLEPDLAALARVAARGVIVTARGAGGPYDFVSRFFAPAIGIDEDPVTGSAHCALAPFWAQRLERDRLTGYQASRRGGTVEVTARGDRVTVGGRAVTVLRGQLYA